MRLYTAEQFETLQMSRLLREWVSENLLNPQQAEPLQRQTVSDLRTTNLFLRAVLFLFTVVIVLGSTALVFILFFTHADEKDLVVPCLVLAIACYAGAEFAVRKARLYHFGIEEALAVCSIGFLFVGLELGHGRFVAGADGAELLVLLACASLALWVWLRFGYWYSFAAAMLLVAFLPDCLTRSVTAQHALLAGLYAAGLAGVAVAGAADRVGVLRRFYSAAEVLLWAGVYLSLNLVLAQQATFLPRWVRAGSADPLQVSRPFYWLTFLLIWCLPPLVLLRGIRRRDRAVLTLGACLAVVTAISNKPYLGWQRHPWDPIVLGMLLMGGAWFLQRWLSRGPGGVRASFTAQRLAGKQSAWMNAGPTAFNLLVRQPAATPPSQAARPPGEGGASGGAGAGGQW